VNAESSAERGWLGWDLGGAHLKAVALDAVGRVQSVIQEACPLWQGLDRLQTAIDRTLESIPERPMRHALTMTGELADLFRDRATGVRELVGVMERRFPGEPIRVFAGTCGLLDAHRAREAVATVASANWLATASVVAARLPQGLLVDIGSTTTDLIVFRDGSPRPRGFSDRDRLVQGELIYAGVARTPAMALASRVPFAGDWVPLMAEHFATAADLYRLTGDLPAHADLMASADGRDKTPEASAARLARMLGLDAGDADLSDWQRLAAYLAESQLRALADASARLFSRGDLDDDAPVVGAGVGRFLVKRLAERLDRHYLGFESLFAGGEGLAPDVADCAPAAAVARLALDAG
jgi:(4-(4-[2-(gamma-L-glutamylamino)ethyl]phenoxymethyl)furan-2-yl)methanamine synthase